MTAMRDVVDYQVTNVDEDGTVTLSSEQPKVGIALTATLEDLTALSDRQLLSGLEGGTPAGDGHSTECDERHRDGYVRHLHAGWRCQHRRRPCRRRRATPTKKGPARGAACRTNNVVANTDNVAGVPKPTLRYVETGGGKWLRTRLRRWTYNDTRWTRADPVQATDPNPADSVLTYTLSGTDAASFDIDQGVRPDCGPRRRSWTTRPKPSYDRSRSRPRTLPASAPPST